MRARVGDQALELRPVREARLRLDAQSQQAVALLGPHAAANDLLSIEAPIGNTLFDV